MRSFVRDYLKGVYSLNKMTEGKTFDLTDAFIDVIINDRYLQFANVAKVNRDIYTFNTVASTGTYTMPSDFLAPRMVMYTQGIDNWMLYPFSTKDIIKWKELENSETSGYVVDLYEDNTGLTMHLYPAPSHTGDIVSVYCEREVPLLVNDGDMPLVPHTFIRGICDGAIFDIMMLAGLLDQTKMPASQQATAFNAAFTKAASDCRKDLEFGAEQTGKIKELFKDGMGRYLIPCVDHSPIVTRLDYLNDFGIYDHVTQNPLFSINSGVVEIFEDTTWTSRMKVDASGIWINGTLLAFVGARGTAAFAGYTSSTVVTIADQTTTAYTVSITPITVGAPVGDIGEFGYEVIDSTSFRVYNTGTNTGDFSYLVTK
jgi:hypothetical protein